MKIPTTGVVAVAFLLTTGVAAAQEATFDVEFETTTDMFAPRFVSGIVNHTSLSITLSGKNTVSVRRHRRSGARQQTMGGQTYLGEDRPTGVGRWRVVDASTLAAVERYPQNVRTWTLRVRGNSCVAQFTDTLRPGFTTYTFPMINGGGRMAEVSRPRVNFIRCTAR